MKNYWSLTEKQRAALTRDDVAKFVDAELMTKGVLKPEPLVLLYVPEVTLDTLPFYRVTTDSYENISIAFRSEADARTFLALRPLRIVNDWRSGKTVECAKAISGEAHIETVSLASEDAAAAAHAALKEVAAAESENGRRKRVFEEQTKAVTSALDSLWEDWHECTAKAARMRKVIDTFAAYREIAEGDAKVARRFLDKAFTTPEIVAAEEWEMTDLGGGPEEDAMPYAEASS